MHTRENVLWRPAVADTGGAAVQFNLAQGVVAHQHGGHHRLVTTVTTLHQLGAGLQGKSEKG